MHFFHPPHFQVVYILLVGDGGKVGRAILPNKDLCDACGQPRASPQPAAKAAAPKGPKVGQRSSEGVGFLGIPVLGW